MPARRIAVLLLVAASLSGCASPSKLPRSSELEVSGTVRDEVVVVRAPYLQPPALDPGAGLEATPAAAPAAAGGRVTSSSQPTLSAMLASTEVSAGARVGAGDVLARLDDRALALGVEIARTAAARSHAEIDVLDARLGDLADTADELARERADLVRAISEGRRARATLVANIVELERALSTPPPGGTPPAPPAGSKGPDPRALLAQLKDRLAKVDAGLAQARAGLAKLDSGAADLEDARAAVRGGRTVLREAAKAADASVRVAEARRAQSVLVAPYDGVVIWIAEPGTTLMANAPAVLMRRGGSAVVDAYLTAEDVSAVRLGARADVSADWLESGRFPGRVTDIRPVAEYPPTSLPTEEIHMTRAFRVSVTLDDPEVALPAGTPVDLIISTG